jgi:NAD(P)-dependent dehydrogenase (short-subunit alcohol dehydrogenase family)
MDVRDLGGKWSLVTGAASGIGMETALELARRGSNLAICDLDEARLATAEERLRGFGRQVITARVDVADRGDMQAFAARVHGEIGAVDILMNNAGVGLGGGFLHTSLEDWDWIVGINLKGVVHGCHFFLPPMVERRRGHVVNVASMAAYTASEALSAYCTTKFAVLGLSEALREELAPHGIGVTAICPGIINTPITESSRLVGPIREMRGQMVDLYRRRNYGPERVAENILRAVQRNRAVAPISPEAWFFYYLKRFAPWLLARFSGAMAQQQRRRAGGPPA